MGKQRRVGKYELRETLGRGNFSKVKRGIHIDTREVVAVKIVNIQSLEKQGMEKQVKREISVLKSMKHSNIVQMKEVLKSTNHIYIVMEIVTGGELFDKIVAAKKFDEEIARKYFRQLIDGIAYCHQNNIAHRDLKPENLLLDSSDDLKISDFGLSGILSSNNTMLSTICGTPHYVAPEVLSGKYEGKKADIWSCGIILFVMLSGCHPFDGDTVNDLFKRIENLEFKYPSYFSPSVRALLDKIIVVDPEQRAKMKDIQEDEWFREGLDDSDLLNKHTLSTISVEDDEGRGFNRNADIIITKMDVENAIQDAKEEVIYDEASTATMLNELSTMSQRNRGGGSSGVNDVFGEIDDMRRERNLNYRNRNAMLGNKRISVRMQNADKMTAFDIVAILISNSLQNLITPPDKESKKQKRNQSQSSSPASVKRNCTFIAIGHPDDIFEQISKFIGDLKDTTIKISETSFEMKVRMQKLDIEFRFRMSVLEVFGTNLCEMYRIKGNTLKFHNVFRTLSEKFAGQDNYYLDSYVSKSPYSNDNLTPISTSTTTPATPATPRNITPTTTTTTSQPSSPRQQQSQDVAA